MYRALPNINVTPLIDVLLVLLIIFMVIQPLRPSRFKALIPDEPRHDQHAIPHIDTLVVMIDRNLNLKLNSEELGNTDRTEQLSARLMQVFVERRENRVFGTGVELLPDITENERIEKTVLVKAPRALKYGEVVKVVDAIKGAGASPIGLQIDELPMN